jgi:hypothetical protein
MDKFYSIIYLQGEKVCICGLAEVSSPIIIIKIRSANRKSVKCQIWERLANLTNYLGPQVLRIYDLWNLVADQLCFQNNQCLIMLQGCGGSAGSSQAHPHPRQSHCSQGTAATTYLHSICHKQPIFSSWI